MAKKFKKAKTNPERFPKKKKRKVARLARKEKRQALRYIPYTFEDKINASLKYIHDNPTINKSNELSRKLLLAMRLVKMNDSYVPKKPEDNQFFTIDNQWDGDFSSLISHVTWKDTNNDDRVEKYLQQIIDSDWGSKEKHEASLKKAADSAYAKNVEDLLDVGVSGSTIDILKNLMNSSDMWHIIGDQYGLGTKEYDSNQAKSDWEDLFMDIQILIDEKGYIPNNDLQKLLQMINNRDNYNELLKWVNDKIRGYAK